MGFGGVSPAGRVSFDHAYRRMVIERLGEADKSRTYRSLATLMNLHTDPDLADTRKYIDAHTLVRRVELFDPDAVRWNRSLSLRAGDQPITFRLSKKQLPEELPHGWRITDHGEDVTVDIDDKLATLLPDTRVSQVSSAGQVPTGFDPGAIYPSRNHPRGLQLTLFGASDALRSSGISVETLKDTIAPDEFAVYSGSAMAQLDREGYGGMLQNPMLGKRPTSKNCPLGLPEMAADFINAYVLGSVGGTAGIIGACATFLYNVKHGIDDIRSGAKRAVLVGNAEAPVLPDVIESYRIMGALAEDEVLMELDGSSAPDHRRACRPFSSNCGFAISEASIYALIVDDELALELGVSVLGSVAGVYVNADGYKKSIPGPGVGNYVTVAKAMANARSILGEDALKQTYMQAHGTGTPQNRVTESHILNELAKTFRIDRWLVGAVKSYVGHTLAPAGGDQLAAILGAWNHGMVPGITTIDHIADDVYRSNLQLPIDHVDIDASSTPAAFVNSKGFGGNNATGCFLSPEFTETMLEKRWGARAMSAYRARNEPVRENARAYDEQMQRETLSPIYKFGEGVLEGEDLDIQPDGIRLPGFSLPVDLNMENPYPDMTGS